MKIISFFPPISYPLHVSLWSLQEILDTKEAGFYLNKYMNKILFVLTLTSSLTIMIEEQNVFALHIHQASFLICPLLFLVCFLV